MNWNEIGRQLRLMQAIVDEAQHAEKMSDLERDLLLETLRKCYTEIKFGTADEVKEEMAEVVAPALAPAAMVAAVVAEKEIEEEVVVEPEVEAEPEIEVEPEPEPEPEIEPEPTPEPEEVFTSVRHKLDRKTIRSLYFDDAPAESAQEVDKEFYAAAKEPAPVEESAPIEEPAPAEEPIPATKPAISFEITEEEPAEEKVVYIADDEEDEEPETPASIFEITDEEPEEESAELPFSFREAEESAEAVKENAEAVKESTEAVKEVAEERAEEVAATIADAVQPVTVLGDVMGAERTTIADSIAPSEDVASVIGGRQLSSLRGAIGLNDKFLLIRDLFGGDNSAYEAAIDGLDGCENLDDAMLYIFDNIEWNGESDGAQLLTELLSRRFQ